MRKKTKTEDASKAKIFVDINPKIEDDDDSESESDLEDDDEEFDLASKKLSPAMEKNKKIGKVGKDDSGSDLEDISQTSESENDQQDDSEDIESEDDEEEEVPQQVKMPLKKASKKPVIMAKKATPEDDDDSEDEDDDLEVPEKLKKPIAKTPIKGSAKKDEKPAVSAKKTEQVSEEEDEDVAITKGTKRSAPDVGKTSPKKIKMLVDENDELIQAQYERIARTEREKLARGIDRLRLHIVGLKRNITEQQVKAAFPKSTKIDMKRSNAFVSFSSPADVDEAFQSSEDLTIDERPAHVVYALTDKNADFDEELLEAQYERSCQIERSRLTYGVNKSELIVKGLPKGTTVAELMGAFDGSKQANINSHNDEGYVKFVTEKDARLAFDRSLDKCINKKKVAVLYSTLSETDFLISVTGSDKPRENVVLKPKFDAGGRGRGGIQKRK